MAYLIGQCANAPIPTPCSSGTGSGSGGDTGGSTGGGTTTSGGSALNEPIPFNNVSSLDVAWNSTMKSKFGTHGVFAVFVIDENGAYPLTTVSIIPDNINAPSNYHFDFGGPFSGIIVTT